MSFSVLMSLYKKEHSDYLRQSLDSIFCQTLPPPEVILVEDGPLTPELYAVLDEYQGVYPELKRVRLSKNEGLGRALNEGLKYCSHELIIRMDTDDICMQDRFERQILYMKAHPDIDISSGSIVEFEDKIDNPKSIKSLPLSHLDISNYIKLRSPLNHPAVIFKKSKVEEVGGYLHFPLFEDWYLWIRLWNNGAKFANLSDHLLYFRVSAEMFKRRGGWNYAKNSAKFQWTMYSLGIISLTQALLSSILRGCVYLLPNDIRAFVYMNVLRSSINKKISQ